MDRAYPTRIVGPIKVMPPHVPPDHDSPTAGTAGSPPTTALAQVRARLLRMILNNERDRRHERLSNSA
jgi:hypothetical protein